MTDRLDPKKHAWMTAEPTRAVMTALTADGGEARFVGGAVRNALVGADVTDVDIATPLTPDEVTRRLENAGLTAVPTGIEHGTITAVAFGKPVEVTTLRRDVSTDGRRAVVAFTTEWNEDAQRRDFTMNAIYAAADGTLFDPTGGVADLRAGKVRFIGDANARIREDYLRILRLFRFHAWYGKGAPDGTATTAVIANRQGLQQLSGERIQKEMLRLLEAVDPSSVLGLMEQEGILDEILPRGLSLDRLIRMVGIDHTHDFAPDPVLRLSALLPNDREAVRTVVQRWRLSNADRDRLMGAVVHRDRDISSAPKRSLYRLGVEQFRDAVRLRWAERNPGDWSASLALADSWTRPVFPIDGRDAMAAGITEGPRVGQVLNELETLWVEGDFKPTRDDLLAMLKELAKAK